MAIMGIGVVSLATLFPISVLRTAQATQLSHAVFLRNNAEALIESNPAIIGNSQIYGALGYGVVDPLGAQLIGTSFAGTYYRSNGTATNLLSADALATLPDSWTAVRDDVVTTSAAVTATNLGASPPFITLGSPTSTLNVRSNFTPKNSLHRIVMFDVTGKFATIRNIHQVAGGTLPGPNDVSWWDVNSSTGQSLTFGPSVPSGFIPGRVKIEFQDRRYTWMLTVRKHWNPIGPVAGADGQPGVSGVDDDNNGTKDDASELHFGGSDDDPNWVAELDLAVFYNRSFNSADEATFKLVPVTWGFDQAPGVRGVDEDQDTYVDWTDVNNTVPDLDEVGWLGSDDNRTATITFGSTKPNIKKGGYMLETTQLKWYRILDVTPITSSSTSATILFDQDVKSTPNVDPYGVFMKGVVEVYSLGSRTGQQ